MHAFVGVCYVRLPWITFLKLPGRMENPLFTALIGAASRWK